MAIKVLDNLTINQIAAGEVIERPASVVKELVENAMDAKATAITVEISHGGCSMIRITDNGMGFEPGEIPIAFLRHATSKIETVKDLETIQTMGFRGEALSSITSVAKVELITKTHGAIDGVRYCIDGGKEVSVESTGCPEGSTFIIRDLFYNTPARKKFLKSETTEGNYIADLMEKMCLSHPEIAFTFIHNGQLKIKTAGNGKCKDIIYHLYGRDIYHNLLEIKEEFPGMKVWGYLGKPVIHRGNRNYIIYYINGRYIKSNIIHRGVEDAYAPYMMARQYPFCCLYFELDPETIDVNVHPTKMELRFSNGQEIYDRLVNSISNLLGHRREPETPELDLVAKEKLRLQKERDQFLEPKKQYTTKPAEEVILLQRDWATSQVDEVPSQADGATKQPSKPLYVAREDSSPLTDDSTAIVKEPATYRETKDLTQEEGTKELRQVKETKDLSQEKETTEVNQEKAVAKPMQNPSNTAPRRKIRVLGRAFSNYWVVEHQECLYLLDPCACRERIFYEALQEEGFCEELSSEDLIVPVIVNLSATEHQTFQEQKENFEKLGFVLEEFGGKDYSITAIPSLLHGKFRGKDFLDILEVLSGNRSGVQERFISALCQIHQREELTCTEAEIMRLMDRVLSCKESAKGLLGRPTFLTLTKAEVDQKFHWKSPKDMLQ
ncbi:MAG: DNA mismatch repair endonuclease MutL [Lachnospiraceae bacterium]|nr:DNA mismatch repair endonuclease MutL [Lachnospiraceae bacterium]